MNPLLSGFCLAALLILPLGQAANAEGIVIIANTAVTISADEVADVYTGEKQFSGSIRLVPVDNAVLQVDFLSGILGMDTVKYNRIWTRRLFRDGLPQPAMKSSDAEVTAYVKRTPGAIGYVSSVSPGVKVISRMQ